MSAEQELVNLLEKKVAGYQELEALMRDQKDALTSNDIARINDISAQQIICMEAINRLDNKWLEYRDELDVVPANETATIEHYLLGPENRNTRVERLTSEIHTSVDQISQLRDTNKMLVENSLNFVRTLLRNITESIQKPAGYSAVQTSGKKINRLIDQEL